MPSKNCIRTYLENGCYHIYNRGVEKRNIFMDDQDYRVFLHLLKYYLSPSITKPEWEHPLSNLTGFDPVRLRPIQTLENELDLLAFCLMPNHFHLLIKQLTRYGFSNLLRKLSIIYSMYFNHRHKRVGHLFQGTFKAILVDNDQYLLHLSRYIHLNPHRLTGSNPVTYPYSSYQYFLGQKHATWIKPEFILSYFHNEASNLVPKNIDTYQKFVEDYLADSKEILGTFTLEED